MEQYIPDFVYQVVSINQYTNDELSKIHDEMSLVMMLNKMQTSDEIKEIYLKVLWSLLMKMNVPSEDAKEIIGGIGGHGMGFLFENMDKIDIQAERELAQKERKLKKKGKMPKEKGRTLKEKKKTLKEKRNVQTL